MISTGPWKIDQTNLIVWKHGEKVAELEPGDFSDWMERRDSFTEDLFNHLDVDSTRSTVWKIVLRALQQREKKLFENNGLKHESS